MADNGAITVLIPIAGAGETSGAVIRVEAERGEGQAPASHGPYSPAIVRLADAKLHLAGKTAEAARNDLPSGRGNRRRWWPRLTTPIDRRAELVVREAPTGVGGLTEDNSTSAQLGLALGLVAIDREAPVRTIIATGSLENVTSEDVALRDRPVSAVGGIDTKLAAIGDWLATHRGVHNPAEPLLVLVPTRTEDGRPLAEAHAEAIDALIRRARQDPINIDLQVRPVSSLAEAAALIGAKTSPQLHRELLAWAGVLLAVLATSFMTVFGAWAVTPLDLDFGKAEQFLATELVQTPVAVRYDPGLGNRSRPPCYGKDRRLQVALDDEFLTKIESRPEGLLGTLNGNVNGLIVIAGEEAGAGILTDSQLPVAGGLKRTEDGRYTLSVMLQPGVSKPQRMKVMVAIRKVLGFDVAGIRQSLDRIIEDNPPGARLERIASLIESLPGAYIETNFRAVENYSDCTEDPA